MKSAASLVAAEHTATCGGRSVSTPRRFQARGKPQTRLTRHSPARATGLSALSRLEAGGLGLVHEAEDARAGVDGAAADELHVVVGLPLLDDIDEDVLLSLGRVGGVARDVARLRPPLLVVVPDG